MLTIKSIIKMEEKDKTLFALCFSDSDIPGAYTDTVQITAYGAKDMLETYPYTERKGSIEGNTYYDFNQD